jgi:hypothetical protein
MTQMGPNDASDVVWAIGMSFLFFVRVFYVRMKISVTLSIYLINARGERR